jgi:hypothetical protein
MKMWKLVVIWVLIAAVMLPPTKGHAAVQYTFYAAPNGSGSTCSQAVPCSLTGVRDKVRTVNAGMTGDIVVYLRGGVYSLTSTFTLSDQDSGFNSYNVQYLSYPGETPVLSGGQAITGWVLHDSAKNIYKAHVGTSLDTRQLYVNGVRAIRARGEMNPAGFTKTSTGYSLPTSGLYANMASWGNPASIELVDLVEWRSYRCGISSITGSSVTMKTLCWNNSQRYQPMGAPDWVENAYELLDAEGEWYLNRSDGYIYYKPRTGETMSAATAVAGRLEVLVSGTGTVSAPIRNIHFSGITFTHATWLFPNTDEGYIPMQIGFLHYGATGGANSRDKLKTPAHVQFKNAKDIRIDRNTFRQMGASGLSFEEGSQNNTIIGNRFEDLSGHGIQIGHLTERDATGSQVTRNNTVSNNYIAGIGREYHDTVGIVALYTDGTVIDHNELTDLPYSAISVGWGWTSIEYESLRNNRVTNNRIDQFLTVLKDGGGIYTLSKQPNSEISGNYLSNINQKFGQIYLDQGSEGFTVETNVVAQSFSNWIYVQDAVTPYAVNNTLQNNYADTSTARIYSANTSINNTVITDGNWPSAAQATMMNAGLEPAYADLREMAGGFLQVGLNKAATASSVYNTATGAAKANDGNTATLWSSASGSSSYPWWQVDLGQRHRIKKLELVARQDLNQSFARRNFEIRASNSSDFSTYVVLGRQDGTAFAHQGTWSQAVTNVNLFQFIRVVKTTAEDLNFAEFRVMGEAPALVSQYEQAASSSEYSSNHAAVKGNDGRSDTLWSSASSGDPSPWWQVDLGQRRTITGIELVARQDMDQSFARRNFEVRASNNSTFTTYTVLGSQAGTAFAHQGTWQQSISNLNTFRYVRVVKTTAESLNFAELRVFGN